LHTYQAGGFYLQSEAAMLAADILHPVAGDQVLDLCSGVGGKATHFAEKMNNQGLVKAVELHAHKLTLLQKNCQRLGVTIVTGEHADLLAMEERRYGKVFLDVPCSGLGV
jgi:16S rRNA (cytosine967-C5)-methyltransferase